MESFSKKEISVKTLPFIITANFPGRWRETEACLATAATLLLEDNCNPTVLNLAGPASSSKTTVLSFFRGVPEIIYFTDKFTPKSFVSCYANAKSENLSKIDLLPRVKHKVMVVPELAPIFRARNEDLIENIAILTRVFDGEGLYVDSGTTGRRGYEGDYMLCWLGATTPIEHNVWKVMAQLGSRMFFLAMKEEEKSADDLAQQNRATIPYKVRKQECQQAASNFLRNLFSKQSIRSIIWDRSGDDPEAIKLIANLAILLAHLRGGLQIWSEGQIDGENFVHRTPQIEQPDRANTVLYNFARGRAILYGRRSIMLEDVQMVAEIAFSSMPDDRRHLFQTLMENNGTAGTSCICSSVGCSPKVAKGLMEQFIALRVAEDATVEWNLIHNKSGSDEKAIKLKSKFTDWLFSSVFEEILASGKCAKIDGVIYENKPNPL